MGSTTSIVGSESEEVKKFSHFPPADVKEWLTQFKQSFPDGEITYYEFDRVFASFFPFGDTSAFTTRLFDTINIGQSGVIDFNELLIAFSILMKGSNPEKLRWIYRFYDRDNDGIISKDEMKIGVKEIKDMVRDIIDSEFDVNAAVEQIFYDLNVESGFLTFDDFQRLSRMEHMKFKFLF